MAEFKEYFILMNVECRVLTEEELTLTKRQIQARGIRVREQYIVESPNPCLGDMIARDKNYPEIQWYVSKYEFEKYFYAPHQRPF